MSSTYEDLMVVPTLATELPEAEVTEPEAEVTEPAEAEVTESNEARGRHAGAGPGQLERRRPPPGDRGAQRRPAV